MEPGRRVVVWRRRLREELAVTESDAATGQQVFSGMAEWWRGQEIYEYAVLVTSLSEEVLGVAQLYGDRAEAENALDELKNQWGWTGFTTQDLRRCQILARVIAVTYNWWSLYTRLAIPNRHTEATTSRPLLWHGIGRQTSHGNQTTLTITTLHAQAPAVQRALEAVSALLQRLRQTTEHLTDKQRWSALLRFIFRDWLRNTGGLEPVPAFLPG